MRPLATNESVALLSSKDPQPVVKHEGREPTKPNWARFCAISFPTRSSSLKPVRLPSHSSYDSLIRYQRCGRSRFQIQVSVWRQKIRELIFQEFSQVANPLQRKVKGTGLGLPLSRRSWRAHWAARSPLPARWAKAPRSRCGCTGIWSPIRSLSPSVPEPEKTESTILIVDDEEAARYVCSRMFRGTRPPYDRGGRFGCSRTRAFRKPARPDLVDSRSDEMPGRTGFEILEDLHVRIRSRPIFPKGHYSYIEDNHSRRPRAHARFCPRPFCRSRGTDRRNALETIRNILHDETLFADVTSLSSKAQAATQHS